ncbi:DUF3696 domain-containing protein [Pectobacterium aroidearum]|uniref:DUF3696 domain-containing protein n=1 Tax=Pectobacterium aroidearum TaxID=1201031 RepID=A0AAW3SSJ5_9GAMM|nr:DUF3696 domain-containing protein [Pectobacterium aroidearum]MBA5202582.1 DUF3696 domain-containing protein [Pectobacterium aroidearum]
MLTELYIKNFKSIKMKDSVDLNKFSILCGSNSSGKSSLIQAILLICQSFSNRYQNDSITLNGHLVRLGAFQDIKNHFSEDNKVLVSFTLPIKYEIGGGRRGRKVFKCELCIGLENGKSIGNEDEYHPLILSNKVSVDVVDDEGGLIEKDLIEVVYDKVNSPLGEMWPYSVRSFISSETKRMAIEYPDFEILGTYHGELLPHRIALKFNYIKKISSNILDHITNTQVSSNARGYFSDIEPEYLVIPRNFILEMRRIVQKERQGIYDSIIIPEKYFHKNMASALYSNESEFISSLKDDVVKATFNLSVDDFPEALLVEEGVSLSDWRLFISRFDEKTRKILVDLISRNRVILQEVWCDAMPPKSQMAIHNTQIFMDAEHALNVYFSRSVKYLGPLRMEPQALYSSQGHIDPNTVGLKGEYTAAVLHKNRDKNISYLSPTLINDNLVLSLKTHSLKYACLEWLSYLGVIQDFQTSDKGKLGYELIVKINKGEKWQDLTHVGVGVSQVLPIVLMFLLSVEDDILIFEQPELHLHPQVQSRLCDLFISIASSNRQCIIETHSEYLINRLRLRIAQESEEKIKEYVSMFFINKKNGVSDFKTVEVNKYGSVIDWPADFFDQTDREIERILHEASLKKKKEKKEIKTFSFEVKNERRD